MDMVELTAGLKSRPFKTKTRSRACETKTRVYRPIRVRVRPSFRGKKSRGPRHRRRYRGPSTAVDANGAPTSAQDDSLFREMNHFTSLNRAIQPRCNGKKRSRFPEGRTGRTARARAEATMGLLGCSRYAPCSYLRPWMVLAVATRWPGRGAATLRRARLAAISFISRPSEVWFMTSWVAIMTRLPTFQ